MLADRGEKLGEGEERSCGCFCFFQGRERGRDLLGHETPSRKGEGLFSRLDDRSSKSDISVGGLLLYALAFTRLVATTAAKPVPK